MLWQSSFWPVVNADDTGVPGVNYRLTPKPTTGTSLTHSGAVQSQVTGRDLNPGRSERQRAVSSVLNFMFTDCTRIHAKSNIIHSFFLQHKHEQIGVIQIKLKLISTYNSCVFERGQLQITTMLKVTYTLNSKKKKNGSTHLGFTQEPVIVCNFIDHIL